MLIFHRASLLLSIPLVLSCIAVGGAASDPCEQPPFGATHGPIRIAGDAAFLIPNAGHLGNGVRSGSGTESDPFVISGWAIAQAPEGEGPVASSGPAIEIVDTSAHVLLADLFVRSAGSQIYPAVMISGAENVEVRRLVVDGPAPIGAVDVHNVRNSSFHEVTFINASDGIGFALAGVQATIREVVHCGHGDVINRRAGSGDVLSDLEIRDVVVHGNDLSKLAVSGAGDVTISNVSGPVAVTLNVVDAATISVSDSILRELSVPTSGSQEAEIVISDVALAAGEPCELSAGLMVDSAVGVAIRSTSVVGYPHWLGSVRGGSVEIRDSLFDARGANATCARSGEALLTITANCDISCGSFVFSGNDVMSEVPRVGVRFSWEPNELTGQNNYFAQTSVQGPNALEDPRSTPRFADAPAAGIAPDIGTGAGALALIMVVAIASLARNRRG